ncbi:MAG: O-antigen ligase family protein [Patescibacteria group bacterium]
MKQFCQKVQSYALYLLIFLLPWQTRWIWHQGSLNGGVWEYGTFSLYATDILAAIIILSGIALHARTRVRSLGRIGGTVAAFFLICFVTVLWSVNKEVSWYAALKLLEYVALFWAVSRMQFRWRGVAAAFISSGFVQAILGIYQFFSQQIIESTWFGLAAHSPDVLGDFVVETAGGRFLRAYGSLPHPNMLAGFLVVCLIVIIGYLFKAYRNRSENLPAIILAVTSFVVMYYGLILTFSRSAWLAFGLAILALFALGLWHRDEYRLRILVPVTLWIVLVTAFSVYLLPDLWETRITGGRLEQQSSAERVYSYGDAIEMIRGNWYQGVGIGSYTQALYDADHSLESWAYQPAHNVYLLVSAESGVFGGAVFLLLVGEVGAAMLWRRRRELRTASWYTVYSLSFIVLLIVGLLDHYLWSLAFGGMLMWLVFGLWAKRYSDFSVDN